MRYILIIAILLLSACAQNIEDLKNEDMVGNKVTVSGTVRMSVKIGSLSGFSIEDKTGQINVRSDELPKEGDHAVVSGILMRDSLFGYYIKAERIR